MTTPLPRRPLPSGNEARDWLSGVADLLEWIAENWQAEPYRLVSLLHIQGDEAVRLKYLLTERIEQHNGFFQAYPSVRDCIQTVRTSVGNPPGAIMQAVRDALGEESADARTVPLATSLVEEAKAAAPILRRHAKPTLLERAAASSGQPKPPATGPAAIQPEATADASPPVPTIAPVLGGSAEGAGQPAVTVQEDPPALGHKARLVYEFLLTRPPHEAVPAKTILDHLMNRHTVNLSEGTLRSRTLPALEPYGLEHMNRRGYRIPESRRPNR